MSRVNRLVSSPQQVERFSPEKTYEREVEDTVYDS